MAALTKVKLEVESIPGRPAECRVEVGYEVDFAPGDVGQPFRVSIALRADDRGETPAGGLEPLHSFRFGPPDAPCEELTLVAERPGRTRYVQAAVVPMVTLDEDPGRATIAVPGFHAHVPRRDEVFAEVTLRSTAGAETACSASRALCL